MDNHHESSHYNLKHFINSKVEDSVSFNIPLVDYEYVLKSEQDRLINVAETDPNKFWKSIGKMGIKQARKPVIPMEVYDSHGSITGNVDKVLSKWKDDISSLFKDKAGFDDEFLASMKVKVQ